VKPRPTVGDIIFTILNHAVYALLTLVCVFPFYYLFINTISANDLVRRGLVSFYPVGLHIDNYLKLSDVNDLSAAFLVSVSRTVIGTLLTVAASAFVGYLMTRNEMWRRKLWYRLMVVTLYFNAGLIPWFTNMQMLGLTNRYLAYIIPGIMNVFNMIMVKTYIESIPREMEESAAIDGAPVLVIFRRIIWPLSKPILATIAVWSAVTNWNSFTDSLILMSARPQLYTLQHRLWIYLNTTSTLQALMSTNTTSVNASVLEAALNVKVIKYTIAMVTAIPILIVYPFMQRYFEQGIMLGAVKG
jgi:multiple sugar transport system permease protein/putative aldouronate transport system permease protein